MNAQKAQETFVKIKLATVVALIAGLLGGGSVQGFHFFNGGAQPTEMAEIRKNVRDIEITHRRDVKVLEEKYHSIDKQLVRIEGKLDLLIRKPE